MNLRTKLTVLNLFCLAITTANAQTYTTTTSSTDAAATASEQTTQTILNWAALLGYDASGTTTPTIASTQLTDYSSASTFETLLYNTFLGTIPTTTSPVTTSSSSSNSSASTPGFPFVPSQLSTYANNSLSNLTFMNYGSQGSQNSLITANPLVDQPPYQADPVSQSIYNILGTPDVSYCTNATTGAVTNPTNPNSTSAACSTLNSTLFQNQIVENVIGSLPDQNTFYSIQGNANLIPQLNGNSLIAPLDYSSDPLSIPQGSNQSTPGLTGQTQAQLAANFIRYVSGSTLPTILPSMTAYQTLYSSATNPNSTDPVGQAWAQAVLSTYLTSLRTYAAQTSVGISNLYYILSRRIPQQPTSGSTSTPTSQALNEYNMATWRIFQTPSSTGATNQWIDKINSASPAAVQKEMAMLLAEINYQLYLDRQIQERILFTNSVSLLQASKAAQPDPNLTNINTSAPNQSTYQNTN
jgi:intracellular multiplication protein IcmX